MRHSLGLQGLHLPKAVSLMCAAERLLAGWQNLQELSAVLRAGPRTL